jgi:hypothetical protein
MLVSKRSLGYDEPTGLLFDPFGGDFPAIPARPTLSDPHAALPSGRGRSGAVGDRKQNKKVRHSASQRPNGFGRSPRPLQRRVSPL